MAGHSEWANRKYRKRKQDRKKAKQFAKYSKKITSAAQRGGGDPEKNAELRNLIERAKSVEMPKDTIQRAIKKGTGDLPGVSYEDYVYEGYGPGGIGVIVDVTTDNKNRSVAEIRKIFDDYGGELGERGCVSYQFEKKGYFQVPSDEISQEGLFERSVEAGAEDVRFQGDYHEVICDPTDFATVKKALEELGLELEVADFTQLPQTTVPVSGDHSEDVLNLLEDLDDHDDVTDVYSNFEMTAEEWDKQVAAGAAGS
ncbi:MAG: YebC/PmpR family DNA-binding transcriptional regulator [bacterium]